jgi:hypothetical protein
VARSVNNIDLYIFVTYGDIFREDGDPSFPLQIIAVEDQLPDFLVVTEKFDLVQYAVHERGLAVVNMSDYGYVSDFFHFL